MQYNLIILRNLVFPACFSFFDSNRIWLSHSKFKLNWILLVNNKNLLLSSTQTFNAYEKDHGHRIFLADGCFL